MSSFYVSKRSCLGIRAIAIVLARSLTRVERMGRKQQHRSTSELALPAPDPMFARGLLAWFERHGRRFPWRETTNAYHILCAELMLQRTRASQVLPVYVDFASRFSTPGAFVAAGKKEARRLFAGLGLLWRAERFWQLQSELVRKWEGGVPMDRLALMSLPGVGHYVSTAVTVFAFGTIATIVDSNVLRILNRYFGLQLPEHARRRSGLLRWADGLAPRKSADCRRFNWALVDLGALVCRPTRPYSCDCPLVPRCRFAAGTLPP
jgi:A/G-specific adenine glycosylase